MTQSLDAERLLRHTGWLRELAYSILGDVHQAEDVVQDTCLVALEQGPDEPDDRGLRAWLSQVARNLARTYRRRDGRRELRERLAASKETTASVADSVERVAAQRALVEAVLALGDLDRSVVVLRYFEGLPPRAIARRLGISGSAVRTRLSRALAKLRARLEVGESRSGKSWALVLAEVGRRGHLPRGLLGGMIVNTTTKLALGATGLLAVVTYVGTRGANPDEDGALSIAVEDPKATELRAGASEMPVVTGPVRKEARGERESVAMVGTAESKPSQELEVSARMLVQARCVDGSGEPLEGVELTAVDLVQPVTAISGSDGRVQLEIPWPMELQRGNNSWVIVEGTRPGWTRVRQQERVTGPEVLEIGELQFEAAGIIVGRVVYPGGLPVASADVYAVGFTLPGTAALEEQRRVRGSPFPRVRSQTRTHTDAEGNYRIAGAPARTLSIVARTQGHYVTYSSAVEVPAGAVAQAPDLVLQEVADLNRIRGEVIDERGPVGGAYVRAFENRGARNINPQAGPVVTDAAGNFELVVMSETPFTLEATHPDQVGFETLLHDVVADGGEVRIEFPVRRRIHVVVTDPNGGLVERPRLQVFEVPSNFGLHTRTEAHEEGGVWLSLPNLPFKFSISAQGHESQTVGPFEADSVGDRLAVVLARSGSLRGRVTAGGSPVAGAWVHLHRPYRQAELAKFADGLYTSWDSHYGRPNTVETDAQGNFEIPFAGSARALLHASAAGYAMAEAGPFEVLRGETVEHIEMQLGAAAVLEGRVLVAEGIDVTGTIVAISRADGHVDSVVVDEDGGYHFDDLTPGGWQVQRGTVDDQEQLRTSRLRRVHEQDVEIPIVVELSAGVTTSYDLDFTHEQLCRLRGHFDVGGSEGTGWRVNLHCLSRASGTPDSTGDFMLSVRGPGRARLFLSKGTPGGGTWHLSRALTLTSGDNTFELSLATGTVDLVDLADPEERDPEIQLPGYALFQGGEGGGEDGTSWSLTFDPDEEGLWSGEMIPAGSVELRRRPGPVDWGPWEWPMVAEFEVIAGQRVEFRPETQD